MTTIGLKQTDTYCVAWAAEGDRAVHKLERIIIEIYNALMNGASDIHHNETFLIKVLLKYMFVTADHHAQPSATAVKSNVWRVDRFEQRIDLLWIHIKQSYDFILTLKQYWNRYQSELDWVEKNQMSIESGMLKTNLQKHIIYNHQIDRILSIQIPH